MAQILDSGLAMKRWLPLLLCALAGFAAGIASTFWPEQPAAKPAPSASPAPVAATGSKTPADPKLSTAIRALASFDRDADLRTFLEFGAQFTELNSEQMSQLLDYAERHESGTDEDRSAFLMQWWLAHDPAAAKAWLQPRLQRLAKDGPGGAFTGMGAAYKMVKAWAKVCPQEALDFARANTRAGIAIVLVREAFATWPEKRAAERFALLRDFPAGPTRSQAYKPLFTEWARQDNAAALAAAETIAPGEDRTQALGSVLKTLAIKQPASAMEHCRRLGLSDPETVSEIVANGAAKDSTIALAWLSTLDPLQARRYGPHIAEIWAETDPAAALSWALAHDAMSGINSPSVTIMRHDGFSRVSTTSGGGNSANPTSAAMSKQPKATLEWIASLPDTQRSRMSESAISYTGDPDAVLSLFAHIAPDRQPLSASAVVNRLNGQPGRAEAWAGSLPTGPVRESAWTSIGIYSKSLPDSPPGPDRDALLAGYTFRFANSAETSLDTALQISNPTKRREIFDRAMENFTVAADPQKAAKARTWLEKADIPAAWKQPWQKPADAN